MTMTDDIIDQLSHYVTNEMRMPAGLIVTVIEEIERLRNALDSAISQLLTHHEYELWTKDQFMEELMRWA